MCLRIILLLVGMTTFGRQASSDFQSKSYFVSSTPPVENLICPPHQNETCSASIQSSSSVNRMIVETVIEQQDLRLNAITEELNQLEAQLNRLRPLPEAFHEYRLRARVSALEESGCEPGEVQCGARTRAQCVSDLFVCDGIRDCINGRDEDPNICSEEPVKVGNSYVGLSFWNSCLVRRSHRTMIVLTKSKRSPSFKSRVWLKALVIHHVANDIETYNVAGYFNFARRQLLLLPVNETGEDLAVLCLFNRGDHVHADCKIVQPGSFNQCGFVTLSRL